MHQLRLPPSPALAALVSELLLHKETVLHTWQGKHSCAHKLVLTPSDHCACKGGWCLDHLVLLCTPDAFWRVCMIHESRAKRWPEHCCSGILGGCS